MCKLTFGRLCRISLVALAVFAGAEASARNINVRGKVINSRTEEPLFGVSIYNVGEDNKLIGSTNEEGHYTVNVDDTDQLLFSAMGCEDLTVDVNNRINIDVALIPEANQLGEVVVTAKSVAKGLIVEPTDIEVKGNNLYVKTRVTIPENIFSSSSRMIIQPAMCNVTKKEIVYMKPEVFDGRRYAITQERMYDWEPESDPLNDYVVIEGSAGTGKIGNVVYIRDSVYVENPKHDFFCEVMSSMETYNNVVYTDTFVIARGTVNPMRFLSYNLKGSPVVNEKFFPTPEMQLRDTKGDVKLTFSVGKSRLDMSLGDNQAEMDALLRQLHDIENDPDMALKSFTISGTASPEGNYDSNRALAKDRMQSAMDVILNGLSASTRRNLEVSTEASVASWDDVAALMRADGKTEEAEAIEEIIDRYPSNITRQGRQIMGLPYYTSLIKEQYLPRLRRVQYEFVTSKYRYLTDDEIVDLYKTNSSEMSRYEFWRLYSMADSADREPIIKRALEVHPKFLVAATDLADIYISQGKPDPDLIDPILSKIKGPVPDESRLNQAIACLAVGQFSKADSLVNRLPDNEMCHKLRIYSAALNGRYHEAIQEISADSPFNEVLLLLAIKADKQAYEKSKNLGGSALEEYIKATAANRVDEYLAAITHIEKAFKLDPSLRDIARIDGDVIDLLEEEDLEQY